MITVKHCNCALVQIDKTETPLISSEGVFICSIGSYKTEKYYSNNDKVYEITYDCENYEIIEVIRRKPGEAEKKTFLDDIKDFVFYFE